MTTNPANPSEAWEPELEDESAMVEFEPLDVKEAPPFLSAAETSEAEEIVEARDADLNLPPLDFRSDDLAPVETMVAEAPPLESAPPPFESREDGGVSAVLEASAVSALMDLPEPRGADGALLGDITLPRISIHAFIENVTTAQMLQAAASDRRLAKAAFNVTMGGIPAAIMHLGAQQGVNLLVVESVAPAQKLLADLDHLAEFCDAGTKVIVIGQQNDIALYRELMRRGVSEYLVPPMHPLHFIRAAANLYADATAPFVGRSIAFVGAKGGVGASTISHNIAWSMANRIEVNTTLVDLDLSFGTSGLDFNQDATQGVAEALSSPDRVDDVVLDRLLTRCSEHLTLFSAPASVDRSFEFPAAAYQIVIERVRRAVPYVVLDLPHVWTPWVRQSLSDADDVVMVCTPDLSCLRNAKNLIDVLRTARANDAPPKVILNMVGVPKRPEIPVKDFGEALGITPVLVLPFEAQIFAQAANNGQMLAEVGPQSKTVEGIEYLAAHLTGRSAPAKRAGLLSKLSLAKR